MAGSKFYTDFHPAHCSLPSLLADVFHMQAKPTTKLEDDFIEIIKTYNDYKTLVSVLKKKGYVKEFTDQKRLLTEIREIYSVICKEIDPSHDLEPLPGRVVEFNGCKIYIHGIVHDDFQNKLSDEYKNKIRSITSEWDVLCEDGFAYDFLPSAIPFGEIEALGINRPMNMFFHLPLFIFNYFSHKIISTSSSSLNTMTITTIADLRETRKILFSSYLPEPLGMSAIRYINPKSIRLKRYVYEAQRGIEYLRKENLNQLHLLVGCAHELPLEYLLKQEFVG